MLLRVAGSVFLMWLQSRESRRNARLLQHIGCDPWDLGWTRLWTEPCLYICLPVPLRACKHGVVLYVGESVSFQRRFEEHILRLLDPKGQTQQPFYHFVRRGCVSDSQLLAAVSFFMLLPVSAASHDRKNRLEAEVSLTAVLGTLNPPRVYSLAGMTGRRSSAAFGQRIFGASKPLCRIRSRTSSRTSSQIPLRANGHARRLACVSLLLPSVGTVFRDGNMQLSLRGRLARELGPSGPIALIVQLKVSVDGGG